MEISESRQDGYAIVAIGGRVDASNAPELEQRIVSLLDGGETRLVLDCSELAFLSSAGLRVCLMTAKRLHRAEGKLGLAAVAEPILHIFEVAGLAYRFAFFADRDEAIKGLG